MKIIDWQMIFHDVLLNFEDVKWVQSDFTFTIHFIIILYSQRTKNTSVKFSEHENKTMENKMKSPFVSLKGSISPWCTDSDANGILTLHDARSKTVDLTRGGAPRALPYI